MYYLEPKNLLVDTFGQGTAMVKSPECFLNISDLIVWANDKIPGGGLSPGDDGNFAISQYGKTLATVIDAKNHKDELDTDEWGQMYVDVKYETDPHKCIALAEKLLYLSQDLISRAKKSR